MLGWTKYQQAAREWGLTYIETSAKEDINIETAFKTLVAQCLEKMSLFFCLLSLSSLSLSLSPFLLIFVSSPE
jgi:hypothetical protein